MQSFAEWNTCGIRLEEARRAAESGQPLPGGVTAGQSTGTSGGPRGIFLASPAERRAWAGTMMARILPRPPWRAQRVALFLRDPNALYRALDGRGVRFTWFPPSASAAEVAAFRPTVLAAPPRVLARLGEESSELSPDRVVAIAETIDPIEQRQIAARFSAPVHQIYQATEGFLAATCERGTLHLNEDFVVVEKEWLDRPTGRFQPVVTDLRRRTQPVVRLRLDDILVERRAPCSCGRRWTALEAVEGRLDEILLLPRADGAVGWARVFPGDVKAALARVLPSGDYRLKQESTGHVTLALAGDGYAPAEQALDECWRAAGGKAPRVKRVPFPAPASSGEKLRRVVRRFPAPASSL